MVFTLQLVALEVPVVISMYMKMKSRKEGYCYLLILFFYYVILQLRAAALSLPVPSSRHVSTGDINTLFSDVYFCAVAIYTAEVFSAL